MNIKDITVDQVFSVYSGKAKHCCCGCSGKHVINPQHKELRAELWGYEVEDKECSLRSIKLILNKCKAAKAEFADGHFWFETEGKEEARYRYGRNFGNNGGARRINGRLYIVYLVPSDVEVEETRARKAQAKIDQAKRDRKAAQDKIEAIKGVGI
jgi:hypothetical protein